MPTEVDSFVSTAPRTAGKIKPATTGGVRVSGAGGGSRVGGRTPQAGGAKGVPLTATRMENINPVMRGSGMALGWLGQLFMASQFLTRFGMGPRPADAPEPEGFKGKAVKVLSWLPTQMARPTSDVLPTAVTDGLGSIFGSIQEVVGKVTGAPDRAARRADRVRNDLDNIDSASGVPSSVRGHLGAARDALKAGNGEDFHTAYNKAEEALHGELQEGDGFWKSLKSGSMDNLKGWNERRKHNGQLKSDFKKATMPLHDSARADAQASFWHDPVGALKNRFANQSLEQTTYDALRYGGLAMRYVGEVKETRAGISSLKQLHADIMGGNAKDVGILKLWSTYRSPKTPKFLKNAIYQYGKTTLARWGFLTLGTWGQQKAYETIGRKTGNQFYQMAGSQLVMSAFDKAEQMFTGPDAMMNCYETMRNMQHLGARIHAGRDPDLHPDAPTQPNYSRLITAVLPELDSQGTKHNKTVVHLAYYFERHQTPIAEVMKILAGGKKAAEALAVTAEAEYTALKQQAEAQAAQQASDLAESPGTSLLKPASERRVLQGDGKFTSKVASEQERQMAK